MASDLSEPLRRCRVGDCDIALLPRRAYEASFTPRTAVIGFAFERQTGTHAFASDRRQAFQTRPNSLAFVPAGCEVFSSSPDGGEYLTISGIALRSDERRFNDLVDARAMAAAQAMRRAILFGGPVDPLKFEAEFLVLQERVEEVMAGHCKVPRAAGWLTSYRVRLIEDLIEAGLEDGVSVHDLAKALDLSPGFFTRAFKAAMGKPPHDYVLDRRISRARTRLRQRGLNLSRIALDVGFASHAHMTAAFRKRLGMTPSGIRAQMN